VTAVFLENITSPKLVQQIARETGTKVGATLYSDALSQPGTPGASYLGMFAWNAQQIAAAMQP
jgi:zinc/manganese transport system substrate-binding protein